MKCWLWKLFSEWSQCECVHESVFKQQRTFSIASSKHKGELGEFKTVMQTHGADETMETRKKSSIAFIKYFSKTIRQMKANAGFCTSRVKQILFSYQPIKTCVCNTTNQNSCDVTAVFPYSKHSC